MYLNGVEEASTRYWHTQLFKLLGILPVLVHEPDKPKEVLVIAFGAGITAGSVLASDQVASLDTSISIPTWKVSTTCLPM
jgi:spermidine synthase